MSALMGAWATAFMALYYLSWPLRKVYGVVA